MCECVCVCMCVCGGGGVGGGGGGRADEDLKTRTPHNDVGKNRNYPNLTGMSFDFENTKKIVDIFLWTKL